jgi:methylated-DNA-[protein]-cysteine S-methyltransferase
MFSIVWQEVEDIPKVRRIFLSKEQASSESLVTAAFTEAGPLEHPDIVDLGERIQRFLEGQVVQFELDAVALEICSEFQRRVLLAEYGIPRGHISTYGRIGKHLGLDNGGRAVGRALAQNPFPIVIPCHRAVRSNGELGGYQGGSKMKKDLLELEGVGVSESGRVSISPGPGKVFY